MPPKSSETHAREAQNSVSRSNSESGTTRAYARPPLFTNNDYHNLITHLQPLSIPSTKLATQAAKQQPNKAQKHPSLLARLFRGQILSSDFFVRHWLPVVLVVLVAIIYITTKYTCQTNMEKIAELERKLEIVNNEKSRERSKFMGRIRETSMQQLVDSLGLNLNVQTQPPFKIPRK